MVAYTALVSISLVANAASAAPEDEVRATLERFVAAQNAHGVKALESLLLNSPDFLWITRGTPVWGADSALKRFGALYEGTWRLDAETSSLRITMLGDRAAQIYVPIMLQKSKIISPKNLAKVDFWTSLPLRRFSAPLGRSVVDFG